MLRLMAGHSKGLFILPVLSIFSKPCMRTDSQEVDQVSASLGLCRACALNSAGPLQGMLGCRGDGVIPPPQDWQDSSR